MTTELVLSIGRTNRKLVEFNINIPVSGMTCKGIAFCLSGQSGLWLYDFRLRKRHCVPEPEAVKV